MLTSRIHQKVLSNKIIGPFRHSDISVKAVNQHGGRVVIYVRLSGHMTHEKGLYSMSNLLPQIEHAFSLSLPLMLHLGCQSFPRRG